MSTDMAAEMRVFRQKRDRERWAAIVAAVARHTPLVEAGTLTAAEACALLRLRCGGTSFCATEYGEPIDEPEIGMPIETEVGMHP